MQGRQLERARAAAGALIDMLRPDDLVEVMSFNDYATVRYPMGADHDLAKSVLAGIPAGGGTALYEAVLVAVHNQDQARRDHSGEYREVVVVLSDGENTAGQVAFDVVLDRVRRSGVMVYTIATVEDAHSRVAAPPWEMAKLAFDSGGLAVSSREPENLTRIYQDIAAELLHLYRVGYSPAPLVQDGSWRRVTVRAAGKGVVVRARSGYYAPDTAGTESPDAKQNPR
jgi:Ca-activated chloride channel family protein